MSRLARIARGWALLALGVLASAQPLRAQEAPPDAAGVAPRAAAQRERTGQRIERIRADRTRILRQAPPDFETWSRDLSLAQRHQLDRRLRRMPDFQRERFFREWSRMSIHERRELAGRMAIGAEARHRRELPPRLRTPEMRERLEHMSPEQRRGFFARAQAWRELEPGERGRMRARLTRFGALNESEQQALIEAKFKRNSPEERARILHELREASREMRELHGARERGSSKPAADSPPRTPQAPAPD